MTWQRPVEELHEFFEAWFNGTCDRTTLATLETALADDFTMVTPNGARIARHDVIESIRGSFGGHPGLQIRVDGFEQLLVADHVVVGRYIEHHSAPGAPDTMRISTAAFSVLSDGAMRWLTVHETWQTAG